MRWSEGSDAGVETECEAATDLLRIPQEDHLLPDWMTTGHGSLRKWNQGWKVGQEGGATVCLWKSPEAGSEKLPGLWKKMWCFVLFPSFLLLFKAWHPLLSVTIKKTGWLCNLEVLYHSLSSPIGDRPPSNLSKKHLKEHCPARTSRSSDTGLHFSSVELV